VLLPIWIAAYRYNGKPYQFLVNGQTGEVVGKAPWSFWKIFLFVTFLVSLVVGGIVIYKMTREEKPVQKAPATQPAKKPGKRRSH
jgi:hypothetical protein